MAAPRAGERASGLRTARAIRSRAAIAAVAASQMHSGGLRRSSHASGGAGRAEHLADAIETGGADAALAAGIFHFGECTIREVKELFLRRGIPVRPPAVT
jgi:hypothetical protein